MRDNYVIYVGNEHHSHNTPYNSRKMPWIWEHICLSFVFYSNLNGKGPRYFRGLKLKYKNGRQKNYLHVLLRVMFCIIIRIIIIMKNNNLKVCVQTILRVNFTE